MFAAKSTPWSNESVPDQACNSIQEITYNTFDEIIFAKYIPANNVINMAPRHDWVTGTVYAAYDDQDVLLSTKNFYVVTSENGNYNVWKCLSNNNGSPSTTQPLYSQTADNAEYYATADGYQWKYLYTISYSEYASFTTASYIPVIPNANVAYFAANGGIESMLVTTGGNNYNSYTSGYFSRLQLAGNSYVYAIQSDANFGITISHTSNLFSIGETILQPSTSSTATVIGQSNNVLTTDAVNGQFAVNSAIIGLTSNSAALPIAYNSYSISANNNFYTGSTIYIENGTGSGQTRLVTNYNVSGTQRIITIDTPFTPAPDFTSNYLISPTVNIIGDGTGAKAILVIDPVANSVSSISIINRGNNYSYANVSIVSNTGFTSNTFTAFANVRPIISPVGGHGADVVSELNATNIGFSGAFVTTENGQIPDTTSYRKVGILSNPIFANVALTITGLSGSFVPNESVTQYRSSETVDSITRDCTSLFNYYIGNYVNLNVANGTPFTAGSIINQTGSSSSGVVITTSPTVLLVRTAIGAFSNVYPVYLGNTSTNTAITTVAQGFSNTIFGVDGANNVLSIGANDYLRVTLNSTILEPAAILPANTTYINYTSTNSSAISFSNYSLANTDLISITKYTETVILSNTEIIGTGTVVSANSSVVNMTNVNSYFVAGSPIFGRTSNATANVVTSSQTGVLDYRTILTANYTTGSANVVLGDLMFQGNSIFGYVSSLDTAAGNSFFVGLTQVKGNFAVSSNATPRYIMSADTTKNMQVTGIELPDAMKYSGKIEYFENQIAVQRANTQTEQIKVIITG